MSLHITRVVVHSCTYNVFTFINHNKLYLNYVLIRVFLLATCTKNIISPVRVYSFRTLRAILLMDHVKTFIPKTQER